jgi:hypothetical protein
MMRMNSRLAVIIVVFGALGLALSAGRVSVETVAA